MRPSTTCTIARARAEESGCAQNLRRSYNWKSQPADARSQASSAIARQKELEHTAIVVGLQPKYTLDDAVMRLRWRHRARMTCRPRRVLPRWVDGDGVEWYFFVRGHKQCASIFLHWPRTCGAKRTQTLCTSETCAHSGPATQASFSVTIVSSWFCEMTMYQLATQESRWCPLVTGSATQDAVCSQDLLTSVIPWIKSEIFFFFKWIG